MMFKLLRSYFWWTYERGTLHYDVMVSIILLFLFVGPFVINFHDRPVETVALHSSEVLVREAGTRGERSRFMFQVRADDMRGAANDAERQAAILRVVEPISGEVKIDHYEPVRDAQGKIIAYNAWILR